MSVKQRVKSNTLLDDSDEGIVFSNGSDDFESNEEQEQAPPASSSSVSNKNKANSKSTKSNGSPAALASSSSLSNKKNSNNDNKVAAKSKTYRPAPPGHICSGCGKTKEFCHQRLYSEYSLLGIRNYIRQAGRGVTIEGIERAFTKSYNEILRVKEWELHSNSIDETQTFEPTACVYRAGFLEAVEIYCEELTEQTKMRVEAIVNRDLLD